MRFGVVYLSVRDVLRWCKYSEKKIYGKKMVNKKILICYFLLEEEC